MKRVSGLPAFLRPDIRKKLDEIMKRNLIKDSKEGSEFCIYQTWFEQVGQFQENDGEEK